MATLGTLGYAPKTDITILETIKVLYMDMLLQSAVRYAKIFLASVICHRIFSDKIIHDFHL